MVTRDPSATCSTVTAIEPGAQVGGHRHLVGGDRRRRWPAAVVAEVGERPAGQVADEPGPPRRPGLGRRGPRVGLGERREQGHGLGVAEPLAHERHGRGVVGVAGGRGARRAAGASAPASRPGRPRRASNPIRVGDRPRDRLPRDAVLGQAALADVVQQRGDHQHVGPGDPADQRGRLDAGLDDVPVDGEAVDHRGVRQQPDPLPLRQQPGQRPGLLQRLPHTEQAAPGGEHPHQEVARLVGPGVGQRRRLAHQPRGRRRGQDGVALGGQRGGPQQQHGVAVRPGPAVEDDLAARQRHPRREWLERRPPRGARRRRPRQDAVDPPPGQPREVRDPPTELAHVDLGGPLAVRALGMTEPVGDRPPGLGVDPVGGASGGRVHEVAHVEQRLTAALEVAVRHVDQPRGDQRLEHGRVAQAALRLLQVRHGEVGELARPARAAPAPSPAARAAARARRGATAPASWSAGGGSGWGHRPGAAGPADRRRPGRRPPRPSASPAACGPSGRAGSRRPRPGTRPSRQVPRRRCPDR